MRGAPCLTGTQSEPTWRAEDQRWSGASARESFRGGGLGRDEQSFLARAPTRRRNRGARAASSELELVACLRGAAGRRAEACRRSLRAFLHPRLTRPSQLRAGAPVRQYELLPWRNLSAAAQELSARVSVSQPGDTAAVPLAHGACLALALRSRARRVTLQHSLSLRGCAGKKSAPFGRTISRDLLGGATDGHDQQRSATRLGSAAAGVGRCL